ncbi:MAG: iron ABC transporter permease [Candidatus Rokubacteria bacterium]|nr:iron ABC transporter permease [Candidatus Rokubacteria bacterium]
MAVPAAVKPARALAVPAPSGWAIAAILVAALLAVPIVAVLASLAHPAADVWAHLWRTQLVSLIVNTLALVAAVGAGTLALGTTLAWLVVAYDFPGRRVFEPALILPLAIPAYVIGFAFLGLFDFAGPAQTWVRATLGLRLPDIRSGAGVAVVMTLVFYPYVYLLARAAFHEQGAATLETARSLGRSRTRAFVEVVLPLARPSIVAGTSLAMMEALADFGTVSTFGYRTLTEGVYRVWYGMFDRVAATQLATLLLFVALGLLLVERGLRGRARFVQSQRRGHGIVPVRLAGRRAALACAACAAVLGLAFVLPATQLVVWAAADGGLDIRAGFGATLRNTLALAASAALAAGVLALLLAYARRLAPGAVVRFSTQFVAMGYALPGSVIAVGILAPLAWLDHRVLGALAELLGRPLGLVLTGSVAGLLFAYVVRFLAVSFQSLEASLVKIPGTLDDAARSLGASVGGTLRRVHLPMLRGGLMTALVIVFVETMKEMPATLLLRPFGVSTLAIEVWERTSESLWAEAATPALAIVVAGLIPVYLAMGASNATSRKPAGGKSVAAGRAGVARE